MLTRSFIKLAGYEKIVSTPKLFFLQGRRPNLTIAPLSNSSPSLFNSISLSPIQRQRMCFPQLQKRPCSSAASSSNPQRLGEVKAERMQLSYTCKVLLDLLSEIKLKSPNYLLRRCVIRGMWKWSANCPTRRELLLSSVRGAKTTIW